VGNVSGRPAGRAGRPGKNALVAVSAAGAFTGAAHLGLPACGIVLLVMAFPAAVNAAAGVRRAEENPS
jgi:hypothetical protein